MLQLLVIICVVRGDIWLSVGVHTTHDKAVVHNMLDMFISSYVLWKEEILDGSGLEDVVNFIMPLVILLHKFNVISLSLILP